MAKLSVNLNKIALLRNTRALGIPSVSRAAQIVIKAGADGITVHPRPDGRHVRTNDVIELAQLLKTTPGIEFNIEGNPFHGLIDIARKFKPQQCTLVPDEAAAATSDHGWDLNRDGERLRPLIGELRALGIRVSLFMDPIPEAMAAAKAVGADRVEFYTESYASAWATDQKSEALSRFTQSAQAAATIDLGVNAGHDLNRDNLTEFLKAVPGVLEVSIGHALVADALELGYAATVQDYLRCIDEAFVGK